MGLFKELTAASERFLAIIIHPRFDCTHFALILTIPLDHHDISTLLLLRNMMIKAETKKQGPVFGERGSIPLSRLSECECI